MLCTTAINTSNTIRTQTGAAELNKVSLPTIAVGLVGPVPAVGKSMTSTLSGNTARVITPELCWRALRHVHSTYTATITSVAAVADGPARRDASSASCCVHTGAINWPISSVERRPLKISVAEWLARLTAV